MGIRGCPKIAILVSSDDREPPTAPPPARHARVRSRSRWRAESFAAAASDGRLTVEEYSSRADGALGASLLSELGDLTDDLERGPGPPMSGPAKLTAILGNESREGHWTVPPRLAVRSLLGDCHLELQDAVLNSHVTTIEAHATLGAVTIIVPDGIEVRLSGTAILGVSHRRWRLHRFPVRQ